MGFETIRHPVSGEIIEGTPLKAGDVIRAGDKYDSTTGKWDELNWLVGKPIQDNCTTLWVREAK